MKKYRKADHLDKKMHKQLGADYTPYSIAIQMAKKFNLKESDLEDWSTFKIFDPTVGMGNLILAMKEEYPWLKNENFYGIDIDPEAIKFCKRKFPGGHFQVGDILEVPFKSEAFWDKSECILWEDYIKTREYKIYSEKYPDKIPKEKPINQKINFSNSFGKL